MGLGPEEAGSFGVAGGSMLGRGSCGPIGAGEAALEALRDRDRGHLRGDRGRAKGPA